MEVGATIRIYHDLRRPGRFVMGTVTEILPPLDLPNMRRPAGFVRAVIEEGHELHRVFAKEQPGVGKRGKVRELVVSPDLYELATVEGQEGK